MGLCIGMLRAKNRNKRSKQYFIHKSTNRNASLKFCIPLCLFWEPKIFGMFRIKVSPDFFFFFSLSLSLFKSSSSHNFFSLPVWVYRINVYFLCGIIHIGTTPTFPLTESQSSLPTLQHTSHLPCMMTCTSSYHVGVCPPGDPASVCRVSRMGNKQGFCRCLL